MASTALSGAIALGLLCSAAALDIGRQPPSNARLTNKDADLIGAGRDADLIEAGRDADEEDDFDTWLFAHSEVQDENGPEKHSPSSEENWRVAQAMKQCGLPEEGQPTIENGVIAFLVTRPSDLKRFQESMPRLWYHYLQHWRYPVKVFIPSDELRQYDMHSYGNSPTHRQVLRELEHNSGFPEGYDYEIATFDLEFPDVIKNDSSWRHHMNGCAQAVGTSYKHMNQFFTKAMYEHPSLQKYKYYMRLDVDLNFMSQMEHDPFCMMAKTGRKFMWQTRKTIGDSRCSEGMWDWFQAYQQKHDLTPADRVFWKAKGARVNYVGYAGMGDLDFFRSEKVRKVAEAFNADGRIYLNRWSDQTYYVLLFALFENHSAVGDVGFNWPDGAWCHKCFVPAERFDPVTGKVR